MNLKIKCENIEQGSSSSVRVKILKAPFVNSVILNQIIEDRKRAIVLNEI